MVLEVLIERNLTTLTCELHRVLISRLLPLQFFQFFKEDVVEVFDNYLVVAGIITHIFFGIFNSFYELFVSYGVLAIRVCLLTGKDQSVVLKQLEEEGSVEAVTITSQSSNIFVPAASCLFVQLEHHEAV